MALAELIRHKNRKLVFVWRCIGQRLGFGVSTSCESED